MVPNFRSRDLKFRRGDGGGNGWYCICEWTFGNMILKNFSLNLTPEKFLIVIIYLYQS